MGKHNMNNVERKKSAYYGCDWSRWSNICISSSKNYKGPRNKRRSSSINTDRIDHLYRTLTKVKFILSFIMVMTDSSSNSHHTTSSLMRVQFSQSHVAVSFEEQNTLLILTWHSKNIGQYVFWG